jgi:hypothetical protein
MMVACPPHSPTPLLMMTLPSPPRLPNVCKKLRERRQFQNDGWTKWDPVQLSDELEAKWAMAKVGAFQPISSQILLHRTAGLGIHKQTFLQEGSKANAPKLKKLKQLNT